MSVDVKVLGPGCAKCRTLYSVVQMVVDRSSSPVTLTKIEDVREITSYDLMALPALVIDGEVKAAGRIPSVVEVSDWLATAATKEALHSKEA